MKKTGIIISIVIIVLLSIAATVAIVYSQNNKYSAESKRIAGEKQSAQNELDKLRSEKDASGFLPSDVVKYFMSEAKAGSTEKARLYVTKGNQTKEIKTWLGFVSPLTAANVQDAGYNVTDDTATVRAQIEFENSPGTGVVRNFSLIKEDSNWKIADIKGE